MRLTPLDRALIAHYPLRCHEPLRCLTKAVGAQEHRIRYSVAKLEEAGVFAPTMVVNINALGLRRYTWFISVSFAKEGTRALFEHALISSPSVAFAARLAGDLDYEVGFLVKSDSEAQQQMAHLLAESNADLTHRIYLPRERSVFFQRKYLATHPAKERLTVFAPAPTVRIDGTDRQILHALVSNPHAPQRAISQQMGLSLPALHRRIQSLRNSGVLGPKVQLVRFEKYGALFYSLLTAKKEYARDDADSLAQYAEKSKHAVHYVTSIGAWDAEVGIEVASHEELREEQDRLMAQLGSSFGDVKTVPRVTTLKFVPFPGPFESC